MRFVWMAVLLWAGVGCRRELPQPSYEEGLSLFPLETGRTWIYEVRETTYTTTGPVAQHYLLRMRVDTPTVDAYGRPSFYVVWDTASLSATPEWGFFRVGLAYKDQQQAELWEDNRRYLLLRFPLSPTLRWNRNEYTDLSPEITRYLVTDTLYTLESRQIPRCAILLRRLDTTALLSKAFFYEVYGRSLGLVHRYERLDLYDLQANGTLVRNTDSYHRELLLREP